MKKRRLPKFYLDNTNESREAIELLGRYGIQYVPVEQQERSVITVTDEDIIPPSIISGEGWFQGLDGVKSYIELIFDLDKPL